MVRRNKYTYNYESRMPDDGTLANYLALAAVITGVAKTADDALQIVGLSVGKNVRATSVHHT